MNEGSDLYRKYHSSKAILQKNGLHLLYMKGSRDKEGKQKKNVIKLYIRP